MLTFVPNKHIYGIAKIRKDNKKDNNNNLSTHAIMETKELKTRIEKNYRILMAAVKVREAYEASEAVDALRYSQEFDTITIENRDRYLEIADESNKKRGMLKKAINNFLKEVGREPVKGDLWDAKRQYNVYIKDAELYHCIATPIKETSILSCTID